jgi:chemotaxis signal transduction protein
MTVAEKTAQQSFIVLQLGDRRFALRADRVVELSAPVRLHTFPHTSAGIAGVIVRRGRIVPVCDAGPILVGRSLSTQRFYLVARRRVGHASELAALPVSGDCELASGEIQPPAADCPAYVSGTLAIGEESIGVLDFDALVTSLDSQDVEPGGEEASS